MGLPCSHRIEARIKAVDRDLGRIFIADVHPHWRFKKPDSEVAATREFNSDTAAIARFLENLMGDENDKAVEDIDREILGSSAASEDSDLNEPEFRAILRDVKRNAHIERSSPDSQDSVDEEIENTELVDINEPRTVKSKGRPKGSQNQKPFMTRADKIAAKSTHRDFFEFEYVEAAVEASQGRERGARGGRSARGERSTRRRGGRGGRGGRGEQAAPLTAQKLQAIKDEALAGKAKRQQEMDQLEEDFKNIEEASAVIKQSVRPLLLSKQSSNNEEDLND